MAATGAAAATLPFSVAGATERGQRLMGIQVGADVTWEARLKVATISAPRRTVSARIGDATVRAGSGAGGAPVRAYTSEAAPRIIGGRTMLPLPHTGCFTQALVWGLARRGDRDAGL